MTGFWHNAGAGLTVDITAVAGEVTAVNGTPVTGGTGYFQDDILIITGGGGNDDATISLDTVVDGEVTAVSLVAGGTGYTSDAAATISTEDVISDLNDGSRVYDNTYYDGGVGVGMVEVGAGEYVVNWIYRDLEKGSHMLFVLADQTYSTLSNAVGSQPRTDTPEGFGVITVLIGRIIVVKDGTSAFVESAFAAEATKGFVQSHSGLSGLQGGQVDEYFHLNSEEQSHLTDGLPICLTTYAEAPAKNAVQNVHGNLAAITDQSGTVLNSTPTDITGNNGISKMMIHVGTVTTPGTMRIVGETVNRNTGFVFELDGVSTVTVTAAGSGYDTDDVYTGVTGTGAGTDITVTVTVSDGSVTSVIVDEDGNGSGWTATDAITISDGDIGGRTGGSQATYEVATVGDYDDIIVTTVSIDNSITDANGIDEWGFTDAYITSKWFKDGFTVSTADADLTGVDVYQITFEQFNDKPHIVVDSIDANMLVTNTGASFSGHFYSAKVTDSRVSVVELANEVWTTATATAFPVADRFYRIRDGNLASDPNATLNGTTDGIFVTITFLGVGAYFEDVGLKVWVRILPGVAP